MSQFWTYFTCFLAVYWLISYILFKFPNILHKRKTYKSKLLQDVLDRKGVLHVSHRGGPREHLENTLAAFKHAVALGTNSLEMDVMRTKDGQIVVCHDYKLDRLCGVDKCVYEFNYSEIPPFQAQVPLHFAYEQSFDSTKEAEKDRRMPLLREVFEAFPNTMINVEIKLPTPETIMEVHSLIKEYQREHITIWGCRHMKDTKKLIKLNPNSITFFSVERLFITYITYFLGLLPFLPIPENSMQMAMLTKELKQQIGNPKFAPKARFLGKLLAWIVEFFFKASGPLIKHLEKRGILVIYWVLNNEEDWKAAVEKGTHGIMTDIPTDLLKYMKKNSLYLN